MAQVVVLPLALLNEIRELRGQELGRHRERLSQLVGLTLKYKLRGVPSISIQAIGSRLKTSPPRGSS